MSVLVETLDERVPMRDGVALAADVTVARGRGPRPVLLVRTPYSRAAMRLVHDVVGLARDGWAVVVQDVRGRFDSGGSFAAFTQEVGDGYDTVAWCAGQPWSDGRVAMTGWSYVGATQWLAALGGHPALQAINPVVGAGDMVDAMMREGGAFQVGLVQPWALGLAASDPRLSLALRGRAAKLAKNWEQTLRAAPGQDPLGEVFPGYGRWRRQTGRPEQGSVTGRYGELDVAAFQVAGWYDIFCESALRHHAGMSTGAAGQRARRSQRLVIGPWSHCNQLSNLHPEMDFGGDANGGHRGVLGEALHWMRRCLDGEPVPEGISCYVMGSGWRELESWPPRTTDMLLHLSSGPTGAGSVRGDGLLTEAPPSTAGYDVVEHDPQEPVPTRGGRVLGPFLPLPGPVDQRPVEQRADVLVYTGQTLERPLTVMGMVRARAFVETSGRALDVAVKLCDVHPDGRVLNVVDSVCRSPARPGVSMQVCVDVGSTAYRFAAGHRIRVEVAGSNFPRFDPNPSTGEPPGRALQLEPATHRVHWGGSSGTVVVLPVAAGS